MFDSSLLTQLLLATLLGLGSTLHCLGMCGPLAMLLPVSQVAPGRRVVALLLYNGGRITSYALGGLLAATLGAGLHWVGGDWMRWVLGPLAAALVIATAATQAGWVRWPNGLEVLGRQLWRKLAPLSQAARARGGYLAVYAMGLVWGCLPCGLVYAAFGLAAATGSPLQGALLMVAFGLGTLPSMLGGAWLAAAWPGLLRHPLVRQGLAVCVVGLAVWSGTHTLLPHDHAHHHGGSHGTSTVPSDQDAASPSPHHQHVPGHLH